MPPEQAQWAGPPAGGKRISRYLIWLLAVASLFLLFWRLGCRDLDGSHEARAALNARWYLAQPGPGPSWLPDGTLEAQKPPAYYWAVALCARLLGQADPDSFITRLPAALSGLAVLVALVGVGYRLGCPREGLTAAGLLLGMAAFVWLARTARTDAPLGCAIALGLLALEVARNPGRQFIWYLLAACCFAIGWLVKGPMAVVLPGAVLMTRFALGPWDRNHGLTTLLGCFALAGGSLIALPWFWHADQVTDGQFGVEFFGLHHVGRGLGGSRLREHPFWFYWAQLPLSALPASLLIPLAGWAWWTKAAKASVPSMQSLGQLGLAWVLGGVMLLSMARFKRADYLAPILPGLALWLACGLGLLRESGFGFWQKRWAGVAVGVGLMLWCAGWGWRIGMEPAASGRGQLAKEIEGELQAEDRLIFFQVEDHQLAYHLGRDFTSQVTWAPLQEVARGNAGVVVVTEPERLVEGWFIDPAMRFETLARSKLAHGPDKPLVCVRLRAIASAPLQPEGFDAAVRAPAQAEGPSLHAGDR